MIAITPIYYYVAIGLILILVISFFIWYFTERKKWDDKIRDHKDKVRQDKKLSDFYKNIRL